jgi:hypothetical protein
MRNSVAECQMDWRTRGGCTGGVTRLVARLQRMVIRQEVEGSVEAAAGSKVKGARRTVGSRVMQQAVPVIEPIGGGNVALIKTSGDRPVVVGLDVGYGNVKAVGPARNWVMFPSVCGRALIGRTFSNEELKRRYAGDQIADKSGRWFVGRLAMSQLGEGELTRLRGRSVDETTLGNEFRVRMATAAIGKLYPQRRNKEVVPITIATGLPVDYYANDEEGLIKALEGELEIETDQTSMIAKVVDVVVMPQPYGGIYSEMFTEIGQHNAAYRGKMVAGVDGGMYTIDAVLDDNGEYMGTNLEAVREGCFWPTST